MVVVGAYDTEDVVDLATRAPKAIIQLAKFRRGLILVDILNGRHGFILPEREVATTDPAGLPGLPGPGMAFYCLHPSVKGSILLGVDGRQEAG